MLLELMPHIQLTSVGSKRVSTEVQVLWRFAILTEIETGEAKSAKKGLFDLTK